MSVTIRTVMNRLPVVGETWEGRGETFRVDSVEGGKVTVTHTAGILSGETETGWLYDFLRVAARVKK